MAMSGFLVSLPCNYKAVTQWFATLHPCDLGFALDKVGHNMA